MVLLPNTQLSLTPSLGEPPATAAADSLGNGMAELRGAPAEEMVAAEEEARLAPAAGPLRRLLMPAPSRGSRLQLHLSIVGSSAGPGASSMAALPRRPDVEVTVDDPCQWVWFKGEWGQTPAPIAQGWWRTAETPVSRTSLLRLFGHFFPETHSL